MKHPVILLAVIWIASCSSHDFRSPGIDVTKVPTEAGYISGLTSTDRSVLIFKGIPFAEPPVGNLRWKAPVPVQHWEGIKKCEAFSASAMQAKPAPFAMWSKEFMAPEEPLSEDCLYLNVWTPAKNAGQKLPVMVWIHGGAFTSGSGSVPLYDGEEIAGKGVVFITINYRLGIFGFLAHPELSKESPQHVSGNYGILDQIAALKWVKANITAFGGDPENVTIAGQSAGAFSVNALVVSPLAKGLFQRAIAQSGGMFTTDGSIVTNLENAEKWGLGVTERLKMNMEQFRQMPAEDLLKVTGRFGVNIDGAILPSVNETFSTSSQNDVPLMTGWNADEFYFGSPMKALTYKADAEKKYGENASAFLKVFPACTDEEAARSQKLFSVLSFGWQNYHWASVQNETGKSQSYLYYFSHVPPGLPDFGAFHSAEFGYALKTLKYWNRPFTAYDHQLSEIMSSYWVNFATNGNPNGKGLPEWPSFSSENPTVMQFGDEVKSMDLPYRPQLKFLDFIQISNQSKK
jgi:para-nitrobenzyl esterase